MQKKQKKLAERHDRERSLAEPPDLSRTTHRNVTRNNLCRLQRINSQGTRVSLRVENDKTHQSGSAFSYRYSRRRGRPLGRPANLESWIKYAEVAPRTPYSSGTSSRPGIRATEGGREELGREGRGIKLFCSICRCRRVVTGVRRSSVPFWFIQ